MTTMGLYIGVLSLLYVSLGDVKLSPNNFIISLETI